MAGRLIFTVLNKYRVVPKNKFQKNDIVLMKGKFWHEIFRPYETCFIFGFVFSMIFFSYGTTTFKHNDGK